MKPNQSTFKKGMIPWNKEKKWVSTKHRKKLIVSRKGKPPWNKGKKYTQISGERCHFWKGGIASEAYTLDWNETLKRSIRERDKYTCQLCNEQQTNDVFSVHHIDYNKKNCNPNNLITLCRSCHTKTNLNRNFWVEYFDIITGFVDCH